MYLVPRSTEIVSLSEDWFDIELAISLDETSESFRLILKELLTAFMSYYRPQFGSEIKLAPDLMKTIELMDLKPVKDNLGANIAIITGNLCRLILLCKLGKQK